MKMNKRMAEEFFAKKIYLSKNTSLLDKIGINFIEKQNCFLLDKFALYRGVSPIEDHVGNETSINSFHPDDYISRNYVKASFCYAVNLLYFWRKNIKRKVICMISTERSLNRKSVTIKVYIHRKDQLYIEENSDLEQFKINGTLIMSSDDVIEEYTYHYKKWIHPLELLKDAIKEEIMHQAKNWNK